MDYKRLVASSYDAIAERLASQAYDSDHVTRWLEDLGQTLPRGARVLDLGCGAGRPHTAWLAERFEVIGVDMSRRQMRMARRLVPEAALIQGDMTSIAFPPSYFDAVVAIYSVIHVPRDEHLRVLRRIHQWLKPGGRALVVLGGGDTPIGIEADWFGAPMYWSHYDSHKSLELLRQAGFEFLGASLEADKLDPEAGTSALPASADRWHLGPCHLFALGVKGDRSP